MSDLKVTVLDLETGVNSAHKWGKSFPWDTKNWIVLIGFQSCVLSEHTNKLEISDRYHYYYDNKMSRGALYRPYTSAGTARALLPKTCPAIIQNLVDNSDIIVGQNIAFDLMWLHVQSQRHDPNCITVIQYMLTHPIWDTAIAEFYLGGLRDKYPSLDWIAKQRGYQGKFNYMKDFWDSGGKTEDCPPDKLIPYCARDIGLTTRIFQEQVEEAERYGMLDYLMQVMSSRATTIAMQLNGLYLDQSRVRVASTKLQIAIDSIENKLHKEMEKHFTRTPIGGVNSSSNKQISTYFFGGELKYHTLHAVVDENGGLARYKSGTKKGKLKMKRVTETVRVPRLYVPSDVGAELTARAEVYTVNEAVLKNITQLHKKDDFAANLLECRTMKKNLNTYLIGYAEMAVDSLLHAQFDYVNVPTGRLSCSKPNLQNLKK